MIEVDGSSDAMFWVVAEPCCFCRRPTSHWYASKDVACCKSCASVAYDCDVPSKIEWTRREAIVREGEDHV